MHVLLFFFFNDTATTEIYTLSLHDALPILRQGKAEIFWARLIAAELYSEVAPAGRSEEHTSELQSHSDLVCRLLLEKKKGCSCDPGSRFLYREKRAQTRCQGVS